MAYDSMQAQGYSLESLSLADTTTTILAMEKGELDFASVTNTSAWIAVQKGAQLVTVIDDTSNPSILAANKEIAQCGDLNGKRLGIPSLVGTQAEMLYRYIETHCAGTKPNYLVISGKANRIAALLAGDLDASLQDQADLASLVTKNPGDLRAFLVFGQEFPGLTTISLFTRREMIEKYPETVKDWLRALLNARRQIQDPKVLSDELVKRLGMDPAAAQTTAATYLAHKFWDVNGRYTPEIIQQNLDFCTTAGILKEGLKANSVADLSFLNSVLVEIGRE
jgi:ABC-type nitrate/sulfonate/bicarbonate transport system substrate-binding protein